MEKALESVELAKTTGKIKKGTNEVTKSIERGQAKLVVVANDVTPPEIVMHIPLLSKEKGIPCITAGSKEELGAAAGLEVGTVSVAVVQEGEAKQNIKELSKTLKAEAPKEPAEQPKEANEEPEKEDKKDEGSEDKKVEPKEESPKEEPEKKEETKEEGSDGSDKK